MISELAARAAPASAVVCAFARPLIEAATIKHDKVKVAVLMKLPMADQ
jgi:hypothetical protein